MMGPSFSLTIDGADIGAAVSDRILAIELIDALGVEADRLSLSLDDRDAAIALPAPGAQVSLALGMDGALVDMGAFKVDTVTLEAPPRTVAITARAADLTGTIRAPRSQAWTGARFADIAGDIAARNGLTPRIDPAIAEHRFTQVEQASESDLHLMTRLAGGLDAVAKVAGGTLLITKRGGDATVSGAPLPVATVFAAQVSRWSWKMGKRQKYASCTARWGDQAGAALATVTQGSGDPAIELRRIFASQAEAEAAASRGLTRMSKAGGSLSLTCAGFRGDVAAGTPIEISGLHADVDGRWSASRVRHRLDSQGLMTTIECAPPEPGADQ